MIRPDGEFTMKYRDAEAYVPLISSSRDVPVNVTLPGRRGIVPKSCRRGDSCEKQPKAGGSEVAGSRKNRVARVSLLRNRSFRYREHTRGDSSFPFFFLRSSDFVFRLFSQFLSIDTVPIVARQLYVNRARATFQSRFPARVGNHRA